MIRGQLIHPQILGAIAGAGHLSRILIADANFPAHTKTHSHANIIHLGFRPGLPDTTQVLEVLREYVPIEAALVMDPEESSEPEIYKAFQEVLPSGVNLWKVGRTEFYQQTSARETGVVIVTGEQRLFGNIMLTVGVVKA